MAEMKSDLASELHGKVGDKLYRTLATGKIVVTPPSKAPTFIDEKDKDDRDTRMKGYGGSGHFAAVVNDAIKIVQMNISKLIFLGMNHMKMKEF